jgi:menaquinol-cytochrome c reductase iron-sulfur subunit
MMNERAVKKLSRRKFLVGLSLTFAGLSAALVSVPVISALVAPLLEKSKQQWRTVGKVGDFPLGSTKLVSFKNPGPEAYAGVTAETGAWLRRNSETGFIAFAVNCTHLGCPVRWEEQAQLFMCPCHGGVYYKDGSVAAGPPPNPLTKYQVRIYNNDVQILTAPLPITNIFGVKK